MSLPLETRPYRMKKTKKQNTYDQKLMVSKKLIVNYINKVSMQEKNFNNSENIRVYGFCTTYLNSLSMKFYQHL